jgi:hypothetical protein
MVKLYNLGVLSHLPTYLLGIESVSGKVWCHQGKYITWLISSNTEI